MSSKDYFLNETFAASAAPEAIAEHLRREQQAAKRVARRIEWLEDLMTRRTAEHASGVWPAVPVESTAEPTQQGDTK